MLSINLKECKCLEQGIDVHKLKAGTVLLVVTQNSLYKIIKGERDQYDVTIQGGKHFREAGPANFSGSSFGGSMMKIGWIGFGMFMEFYSFGHKARYKTTAVQAARVVGDGWEYDMEWDKSGISTEPKIT